MKIKENAIRVFECPNCKNLYTDIEKAEICCGIKVLYMCSICQKIFADKQLSELCCFIKKNGGI
jgi:transposase-like protein